MTTAFFQTKAENEINKIERIEKEEVIDRHWRIYLDIIGKNGISKLVLRKALPLVNGELKRILNGVCDFDVEVKIDSDNRYKNISYIGGVLK